MAPRRGVSPNTQGQHDSLTPTGSSTTGLPRSTSPSSGFTQFLSKPSKWFTRSASTSKVPSNPPSTSDYKANVSPGPRKHKISRPTDPRPILDSYAAGGASKSVLDLSARPQASLELSRFHTPSTPTSPTASKPSAGLGDLRNISRKAWSRSADDLNKVSPVPFSPIQTSFKERVAEYRNRSDSNASAISPPSPSSSSILNGRHPFPTVESGSPSSSPPRSTTLPSVSISITESAQEEDVPLSSSPPAHVHVRSHSFTPKLPSKLSTPRYPPSPQRGNEEVPHSASTPTKPGFGFHKATQEVNVLSPGARRQTTLLPPPTIVEPGQQQLQDDESAQDPKRASQIVFHSGFINRLADLPTNFTHSNLSLSKGWKPFKLELKGSKLYFYKPPNDRANAIKELFPIGLIPLSEEEADDMKLEPMSAVSEDVDGTGRPRKVRDEGASSTGRKKRAYWGRKTHPDLVLDGTGAIKQGTFEALTHESVFATTFAFTNSVDGGTMDEGTDQTARDAKKKWQELASSVIFAVPSIVGRHIFETEFLRCCSFLISGVDEMHQEGMRERVTWLANEYLRYHEKPVDASAFEGWKKDCIPDVHLSAEGSSFSSNSLSSSSVQAIFQSSPIPGSASPFINTFSPRPGDDNKAIPLLDALFLSTYASYDKPQTSRQGTPVFPGNRSALSALQEDGLTRDVLLNLDPHLVAKSLSLYHRSVLDSCPDNITVESLLDMDHFPTRNDDPSRVGNMLAPLFGSEDSPHWLTKLVLLHILGNDTPSGHGYTNYPATYPSSPGRRSEDRTTHTSRTHSRSELISVWTRIGELCRITGDHCSWRAIMMALCSRPVARLDKAWKRVDPQALAAIESWAHIASDVEAVSSTEPRLTVWGGTVKFFLNEELSKAAEPTMDAVINVDHITKAKSCFESLRTSLALCPRRMLVRENEITDDARQLASYWRNVAAEGGITSGLAVKYQRVEQFMSLSMSVEPKRRGLFEPYFWSRSYPQVPASSLVPLLFPEPLPTLTLFDRSKLVRGRYDSDTSDIQHLRGLDAQLRQEAGRQLHGLDPKQEFTKILILGQGGTAISVYNGELLLVVQSGTFESTPNSRPSSSRAPSVAETGGIGRNPSIRVKPSSSQGLDRKTSIARRSSLPAVSHLNRTNFVTVEPSSDPPLRVIVQAGTLNTLVNVLVHGLDNISVSVADDNGEMSLREGKTRDLMVDRVEFARVWWSVFRSFVTPFVFFELLRKIYISSQPTGSSPTIADYIQVSTKRTEVLESMKEWMTSGGGAQDILDDTELYKAVENFLESPLDHAVFESVMFGAYPVQKAWESLTETRRTLKSTFLSQAMRPTIHRGLHNKSSQQRGNRTRNASSRELPDIDRMDPEGFVDNLDGMASAAFSNVTQEDLYITADLLEVQTADKIGWFSSRDIPSLDELVDIQTIYTQIQEIEPSSLITESIHEPLYRLLPPGVRSCIRAYGIIRKWLISKIVAPRIGIRVRQARIELLVQAIEVSRLRNTETPSTAQLIDQPCVRSFVEAVVTSTLLSVESRLHFRAWQSVGLSRGSLCDSFSSLFLRPFVQSTLAADSLTVDMGWLLERMLEIIATQDIIEPTSQEGQNLINFDKRRHLCNLITKSSCIPSARKNATSDESTKRGFERLNNIEKEVLGLQFDHRGIKEEALKEATTPSTNGTPSMKKAIRPFHKVVTIQIEKNRRDKALRVRLQKEKLQEQSKHERRDDILNKAMRPRNPLSNLQKQHRNKKSMSAFLNFMRPISSAFVSDSAQSLTLRRTPSQLDFATTGKPSLVLSILDAQVAQFINNERSYIFQLDTEDGGHYLLQAINKREMVKWLEIISRVTKNAAQRRLTYLGNSPKPQIADHIHSHPIVPSRDPKAVFGVELEFLLRREAGDSDIPPGAVPLVIEQCLSEVERRGLNEVGIYRIAGAATEINSLRDAYNKGESPIREFTDIHAICDLVKSWFRLLPDPVFPPSSYHEVMDAMRQENLDDRLLRIRQVVQTLPPANFAILRRVTEHLDKVTDYEEANHMTAEALAIVFSPNILRAPQNDFVMILNNMGLSHKLVKALITHFHTIFDETDVEAEGHSEDEFDPPILEEDEPLYDEPVDYLHGDQSPPDSGNEYTPP